MKISKTPIKSESTLSGDKALKDAHGNIIGTITSFNEMDEAIVTAVNCTYGANINPEKIQDVIDALKDCLRQLNEGCNTFYEIEQYKRANDKNIRALNNIKYKD